MMETYSTADRLHRLMKLALDDGSASSIEEAERRFLGYCVCFVLDDTAKLDRHSQAALLTGVALACRVFLGGVSVVMEDDAPLLCPLPLGKTLGEAICRLGGTICRDTPSGSPRVFIGGSPRPRSAEFEIRAVFDGWRAGIIPASFKYTRQISSILPIAPMVAAALAVSECFFKLEGKTPSAGHRHVGLSLWNLSQMDWIGGQPDGPVIEYLPSKLWLIGLGHLGQAFLWGLGLLPYAADKSALLVLQDTDIITPSSFSTSVLTNPAMVGRKKARAMAVWAEERGFETAISERKFDCHCVRSEDEPVIALCGIDNALGRQALDDAGFSLVVEAGLGRGHRDFRTMRLHTLPGRRSSNIIWNVAETREDTAGQPAYAGMLQKGELDQCGVTLLAGKAVGAPFVGAVAACLGISEVLRLLHGGVLHELIDLDLKSVDHRYLVDQKRDFSSLNPGFVTAKS
jgi:hypothetical protein